MTPLQDMNHPSRTKTTSKTKIAELVPIFAARWQLFRKYFPTPKSTIKRNRTLTTTVTDNTRFILKKRPQHTNKNQIKSDKKRRTALKENVTQPPRPRCSA